MANNDKSFLEALIEEEVKKTLLEEGILDFLKKGKEVAVDVWDKVKTNMNKATSALNQSLLDKLNQIKKINPKILGLHNEISALAKEEGFNLMDIPAYADASTIPSLAEAAIKEAQGENNTVAGITKKESIEYSKTLVEAVVRLYNKQNLLENKKRKILTEFDPFSVVGVGLALIGGIPMLLKTLYKIATFFKLQNLANLINKTYKISHHLEEKTIDKIIPDKLSYKWYVSKYKAVSKNQEGVLSFEDFSAGKDGIKQKVEKQMYLILLIPFLFNGVAAAAKAGASIIGAAEGAASTVKALELGQGIVNIVKNV